ncbi:MAG: hypothetical protein AAGN46_06400 [Acidobacteriota bacterium]
MSRRSRRLILVVLALLLGGAATLWIGRDLPRQLVRQQLANAVGGEVELGALELLARDHVILHDLRLEQPARVPHIERLTLDRVDVTGSLSELRAGRLSNVRITGGQLELRERSAAPDAAADAEQRIRIESLHVNGLNWRLVASDEPTGRTVGQEAHGTKLETSPGVPGGGGCDAAGCGTAAARLRFDTELPLLVVGEISSRFDRLAVAPALRLVGQSVDRPAVAERGQVRLDLRSDALNVSAEAAVVHERLAERDISIETVNGETALQRTSSGRIDRAPSWSLIELAGRAQLATVATPTPGTCCALRVTSPAVYRDDVSSDDAALGLILESPDWRRGVARLSLTDGDDDTPSWSVSFEGLDLEDVVVPTAPVAEIVGELDLDLRAGSSTDDSLTWRSRLRPRRLNLVGGPAVEFEPTLVEASGIWSEDVSSVEAVADVAAVRGLDQLEVPGLWPLRLDAAGEVEPATATFRGRGEVTTGHLGRSDFEGSAALIAGGPSVEATWRWSGPPLPRLLAALNLPGGAWVSSGRPSARGTLQGSIDAPSISGDGGIDALGLRLEAVAGRSVTWKGTARSAFTLAPGRLILERTSAEGQLQAGELSARRAGGQARRLTVGRGQVRADDAEWTLGDLVRLKGDLARGPRGWAGAIAVEPVAIEAVLDWLAGDPALAASLSATDLAPRGRVGARLRLTSEPRAVWPYLDGTIELRQAGFADSTGARVLEGLAGDFDLAARVQADRLQVEATGETGGFLLLWDTVFADLSETATSWSAEMTVGDGFAADLSLGLQQAPGAEPASSMAWTIARDPTAEAPQANEGLRWSLDVDGADLAAFDAAYLRQLLPPSAALESLGGSAAIHLAGHGRLADRPTNEATTSPLLDRFSELSAFGHVRLTGVTAAAGPLQVEAADLDLPISIRRLSDGTIVGERGAGSLELVGLRLGDLAVPPIATPIWSDGDAFGLATAPSLSVADGRVELRDVRFLRLLRPDRRVEFGVVLDDLELEQVATAGGLPPLDGTVRGELPQIRLQADGALEVDGGGALSIFGGTVRIGGISGREVLSPYPRVQLAATLENISLEQLTQRIDFGRVTGVVEGEIENLSLFRSVPTGFRATLRSVERSGVRQTVDVRAVQNLTILGTGARPSVLDRGLQSLIDSYRYAELGLLVELEDDVLVLRGLAGDDRRELFLRGRFPFAINIVNASPGQPVSFQAMVRRLQSLDLDAARFER